MSQATFVPRTLADWSYQLIEKFVNDGYLETDYFDFKGELTSKGDPKHNERLTATASAFANTRGGFIIFGIADLDVVPKHPRISGIRLHSDLVSEFGDRIRGASPRIYFEYQNPPISIPNSDKVLFVVHIPQSADRPHMAPHGTFLLRTNEGNRLMTYEEVREAFLRYDERRYKLSQLFVELLDLEFAVGVILNPQRDNERQYPALSMDTTVLNLLMVDVYSIIQQDTDLLSSILWIRRYAGAINSMILEFRAIAPAVAQAKDEELRRVTLQYNIDLKRRAEKLLIQIKTSISMLEKKYGLKSPFPPEPNPGEKSVV